MKYEVGDVIVYKRDGHPETEGIIINMWSEPNPWEAGTITNIDLFITFDSSWLCKLHDIETFRDLNPKVWEKKV